MQRLLTWNPPGLPEFDYVPESDSETRRTLLLPYPGRAVTVDLWAVQSGHSVPAVEAVLAHKPYTDEKEGIIDVRGALAAVWTNPQIVAVMWCVTLEPLKKFASQLPPEMIGQTPPGPGMWVYKMTYGDDAEKRLSSLARHEGGETWPIAGIPARNGSFAIDALGSLLYPHIA